MIQSVGERALPTCKNCGKQYDPAMDPPKVAQVRALSSGFAFCSGHCGRMPWLDPGYSEAPEIDAKAHAIVPGGDIRSIETARQLLSMDDESLIEMAGAIKARVAKIEQESRQALEDEIGAERLIVKIAEAVMLNRITERNAKMLPSNTYKCAIERAKKPPSKRYDVLKALEGEVPAERLKDALWKTVVIDAKKVEPGIIESLEGQHGVTIAYDGDATQLKKLRDDYGGKVAEIVTTGLVYEEGPARLVFEPLPSAEKNVTPALKAVK